MNYFISVLKGQCISTKRMELIKKYIPDKNLIRLHLLNEKLSLRENKSYQPKPYFVTITQKEMDELKKEINKKVKYNLNVIYLLVQSNNLPIVKIEVKE